MQSTKKPDGADKIPQKGGQYAFALRMFLWTFVFSLSFSAISEFLVTNTGMLVSFAMLAVLIVVNIIFDAVASAVCACPPEAFARGLKPRDRAAFAILENAEKVANVCADVIGDMCGIVSGALGASLALQLIDYGLTADSALAGIVMSAFIASLTVGGKALGKKYAIENNRRIVSRMGALLSKFQKF